MAHLSIGFIVQHLWHGIPICLWAQQTMHYDNRPICWHKWCLCWFIWCICHFYRFDAVIKTISVSSWICAPMTDNTKEGSCNENQLDALFILNLFRQSTSTCFGHICSPSSGGILYIYNWYMLFFLGDCMLARPTDSQLKRSIHPDGLQVCPKHVEVDRRNKLRINNASSWFSLHRSRYTVNKTKRDVSMTFTDLTKLCINIH